MSNCGTTPMRARARRARIGTGSPKTVIEPPSGIAIPRTIRAIVLLPAPLGPNKPKHSPVFTQKDRSLTTGLPPYDFLTPENTIAAVDMKLEIKVCCCLLKEARTSNICPTRYNIHFPMSRT
ncbi:protein of unknown function (plasmid) [Cupriavidus taiwanensis]|uniref:Uncharacterized protein n=1 Tax=Cupriavidus taiwanensis TaxID=164546 RepID=A0A375IRU2_9BURK|nr:protein of unknown function [Cupriavidus taiwanensis]